MDTTSYTVLFSRETGQVRAPSEVAARTHSFPYRDAVRTVIHDSVKLDKGGEVFARCTARILSNFGMTRSGPFRGVRIKKDGSVNGRGILMACWERVGGDLMETRSAIPTVGCARDRYLLELSESDRTELAARIWLLTKRLLPVTMGQTSYGLVGASKILFSVLPEVVLPVDNRQWVRVFQTVDMGDIINKMASEIRSWDSTTGRRLNEMDPRRELTTLPSVYNVMAMAARDQRVACQSRSE